MTSRKGFKREVSLGGDFALKLHKGFTETFLKNASSFHDTWTLKSVYALENDRFENDYEDVRDEFLRRGYSREETASHYGFLATVHDKMLDIVVDEGLKIKSCPINTLGHCISGIHLNKHADVCLEQASTSAGDNLMILVTFKFMYGKSKPVTPFEIKKELHAPTPSFDSHIPMDKSDKSAALHLQHINSLVYLYEFENSFLHPLSRPRHVCPVAALVFRSNKRLDTNYSQLVNSAIQSRPANPGWAPPPFPLTNPPLPPFSGMTAPPFPSGFGMMPGFPPPPLAPPFSSAGGASILGAPPGPGVTAYMQYNMMQNNSSTDKNAQNSRDRKRPNSYRDNISLTDIKSQYRK